MATEPQVGVHTAALLFGARDLRLTQVSTPKPLPHQVKIHPRATGICGTDLHYYSAGKNGMFVVRNPLVLGHEAAGEIVEIGTDVEGVQVGDRVAIEPQRPCSICKQCREGNYNLCPKLKFTGSASADPPVQGSLQQLYCHEAAFVHKLPANISWEEGAMVEPLSVAIHAVRRSRLRAGQSVLVLGAGAIGLLCASVAKLSGAKSISMIDIDRARLAFAKKMQLANSTFEMPLKGHEGEEKADFAKRIASETLKLYGQNFELADVVFECTGIENCVNVGIHSAAPGAKVVLVGMGSPVQSINIGAAALREIDLVGLWRYANTFTTAIDLIASGKLDVKSMVSHTFDLSNAKEALELVVAKPPELIKCIITSQ